VLGAGYWVLGAE